MKTKFYLLNFCILFLLTGVSMAQDKLATDRDINIPFLNSQVKSTTYTPDNSPQFSDSQTESLTPLEGFESLPFPPAGWDTTIVNPSVTATQYWLRGSSTTVGLGAYGLSFGTARFNFFNASAGSRQYLQTPNFPATVSGEVLYFNFAYAPYSSGITRDSMIIQVSSDGINFTDLQVMIGDTTANLPPNENMCTALRRTAGFTSPTDAEWGTKVISLPVGTIAIRFLAISGFGNYLHLDNIGTLVPGAPMAGVYTINFANPTGGTNFQTFRDAAFALNTRGISSPVTMNVSTGTYGVGNRFVLTPVTGSSSTNRITFQNSGGPVTIADTGTASTSDYLIMLGGCDWVTFDGINVSCAGSVAGGLIDRGYYLNAYRGLDGARNNVIKNGTITLGGNGSAPAFSTGILGTGLLGGTGIRPEYGGTLDSNKLQSMKINRADRGIGFFVPTAVLNIFHTDLEISNCILGETISIGSPISTTSPIGMIAQGVKEAKVFNNRIDSLKNGFLTSTASVTGISMQISSGRCYNNVIKYMNSPNVSSTTPVVTGIQTGPWAGEEVYVYNNLITGLSKNYTGAATVVVGIAGINMTNFVGGAPPTTLNYVYNNTVILSAGAPVSFTSAGISLFAAGLPEIVRNNCIINTISTTVAPAKSLGIADPNALRTFLNSNYNNLYVPGTNGFVGAFGTSLATNSLTIADWKAGSTGDTNSVSGDVAYISLFPLNIDATNSGNWVLNGKGHALSVVNTDINGAPRNTLVSQGTTDIGANEFNMSVNPSFASESAPPSSGGTSVYMQFGDTVCIVTWGTGGTLPSGLNIMNMTGNMPPNAGTSHHLASYMDVVQVGGPLSGTFYNMKMKFGFNQLFNITNTADMRLAKQNGTFWSAYLTEGTGGGQSQLNVGGRSITVNELNSLSNFTATDINNPLSTVSLSPTLLQPANNSVTVPPDQPQVFVWSKSNEVVPRPGKTLSNETDNTISLYHFQLYTDTNSAPLFQDSTLTDTTVTHNPNLVALTPHWWRVRAKNENGWGPFAAYFKFTTDQASGLISGNTIPTVYDLFQNYPNPFNPATSIKFDIPFAGFVSLKVYDVTGREVANLVNGLLEPASYSVNWNASQFSSGVYFYRIQAGDFVKVQKMILTK